MTISVAVIIVSYNTRELLRFALRSIEQTSTRESTMMSVKTLVVDNGSTDGSAEMVSADFPAVTLIEPGANLGFPRANNLILEYLGLLPSPSGEGSEVRSNPPKYVLLLNPDAALTDGALKTLVDFMEANPQAGICGPSLKYGDGSFQNAAFAFPGLAQVILDLFPLSIIPGGHRLYEGALNGRYSQRLWQWSAPFPVDFVLGAALLIRTETVRVVGGMDPDYFMYCEEMDWALRVHQAGWGVWSVPSALIIHHEAQSSRKVRWSAYERLWKSRLRFYSLHKDFFAPGTEEAVLLLVRIAMAWRAWGARRRFALGVVNGAEAGEEIAARKRIADAARP